MGRCLIVANQTLGGAALNRAVRDCVSRDVEVFHVVVPMTKVEHETSYWEGGSNYSVEAELREARLRAQRRLDRMLEKIQSEGGEAEGSIGSEDPVEATRALLDTDAAFDEIIVSTLPARLSRWLKMDVPSRISRTTEVPLTIVEADE
jgi:hypothetical protein